MDDAYWPAFSTVRARSTHVEWEYVGEGFIKELDFGRVWLRLNEADEGEKDEIIAEYRGEAKDFLKQTLVSISIHDRFGNVAQSALGRVCEIYPRRHRR